MIKRILLAASLVALCGATALASDPTAKKPMSAKQMTDMMKAEMSKCAVCKNMAVHLDEIGPIQMEVVKLNNGVALIHNVQPAKADIYHKAGAEMMAAGTQCMTMTDEQAKTQLCSFCQEIRSVMKSGAKMSNGNTKYGDIMTITSDDPTVQTQIATLTSKCEMMAGMQQAAR